MPHLHTNHIHHNSQQNHLQSKYIKDMNDQSEYAFAYASPIPQYDQNGNYPLDSINLKTLLINKIFCILKKFATTTFTYHHYDN